MISVRVRQTKLTCEVLLSQSCSDLHYNKTLFTRRRTNYQHLSPYTERNLVKEVSSVSQTMKETTK